MIGHRGCPSLPRLRESPKCLLTARSVSTCKRTGLSLAWRSSHQRRRPRRCWKGREGVVSRRRATTGALGPEHQRRRGRRPLPQCPAERASRRRQRAQCSSSSEAAPAPRSGATRAFGGVSGHASQSAEFTRKQSRGAVGGVDQGTLEDVSTDGRAAPGPCTQAGLSTKRVGLDRTQTVRANVALVNSRTRPRSPGSRA